VIAKMGLNKLSSWERVAFGLNLPNHQITQLSNSTKGIGELPHRKVVPWLGNYSSWLCTLWAAW
ncbi:MAG TPA: hypothetical protein VG649_12160, partial [Candidatus Angelobacter sp.]|nr:hypothetical protein [Candidatus Angelobacter sp.]